MARLDCGWFGTAGDCARRDASQRRGDWRLALPRWSRSSRPWIWRAGATSGRSRRRRVVAASMVIARCSSSSATGHGRGPNAPGSRPHLARRRAADLSRPTSRFGYGPEMLQSMVAPFYTPDIAAFEGTSAFPIAPQRPVDTVVAADWSARAAVVALHGAALTQLVALVRSGACAASPPWRWLAVGLLAARSRISSTSDGHCDDSSRWCGGAVSGSLRARSSDAPARRAEEPAALDAVIWLAGGVGVTGSSSISGNRTRAERMLRSS